MRAETQADVEIATRRNQTRRLMRQRELEQERRHARDMAQVEQGYIPETWQRAAALNERYRKYGYGPERAGMGGSIIGLNVASSAADGLLSGQEADKLGRDVANAAAEGGLFFIVYELIKSAFKITAKNIGKNVLGKIPSGTVPVLLPAATAGYFITDAKKMPIWPPMR